MAICKGKPVLIILAIICLIPAIKAQTVITAGNDTTICLGGTATLTGTVVSGSYGTTSYTFETFTYSPEAFTGGTGVQFAANQDDQIAGPFDIGFTFCFFNNYYTQFYIGSNGWVGFSYNTAWTTFTAAPIPNTAANVPKNCIMAPWQDWWPGWKPLPPPNNTNGTNVYYYLTGTAPNRKLVVYWINCPLYNCTSDATKIGTFQIVLNEQNSIVENHIQSKPNCSVGENATQGVHNIDGTIAFTAVGRNCTPWTTTNESTRFVPSGIRWFTGGYPGGTVVGYGETITVSPTVTTTYTVAVESCSGGTATDDVTVFVIDAAFSYSAGGYCSNDPDPVPTILQGGGSFTSTPPGLVFIDNVTGQVDLSASIPGTYTITRTINTPCTVTYSQPFTVNPTPPPPIATADSIFRCGPGDVTLSVVANPNEQYSWYLSPVGGSKLGTGASQTFTIAATTPFYVDVKNLLSGCTSLTRKEIVGVVRPIPLVTNPGTSSICSGTSVLITPVTAPSGGTLTWTATGSAALGGFSDGSGTQINQLLTNSGYITDTVYYSVYATLTGCQGPAVVFKVAVKPIPDLSNTPLTLQICNNTNTNITLTSNVAGTLFTWTCTASSGNVTGWADNPIPGITLDQLLSNSGFTAETVTYHITPSANGCTGSPVDYVVTIEPTPDVFFIPPTQSLCSGQTTGISINSAVTGTTFTWTVSSSSPNLTGQLPGNGNLIAQTISNSGTTTEFLTYNVVPSAFGCPPGPSQNVIVTIKPNPSVTNTVLNYQQCSAATTGIALQSSVTGTTFSWVASGSSASVSGYSNSAGPVIAQTLVNSGFNIETVTYQVTPVAGGCTGNVTTFTVTVYPVPNAVPTPATDVICSGAMTGITISSGVAGATFSWIPAGSSPSVTGFSPGTGSLIQQTLDNSGYSVETVTYTIIPTANGCSGITSAALITVNPLPAVSFPTCFDTYTTTTAQSILLKGAIPAGGTYSGTGVAGNLFVPSVAGPGAHAITYSYSNVYGCSSAASQTINVIVPVPFTCGNLHTDIRDSQGYPTALIGTQCWISVNLNYGNTIPSGQMQRDNCQFEKYCFGDVPGNCTTFGGLYQWDEMMMYSALSNAQGFCPPDWHVPNEADWLALFSTFTNNGFAGSPLKYSGFSGFNAFLSGVRFNNVQWDFSNFAIMYWSSSAHGAIKAWAHGMNSFNPSVSYYPSHRNNSFPIRCIKD